MATHTRQGDKLVSMLKRRGMTTLEMIQTGISVCPWKRVRECLPDGWQFKPVGTKGRHTVYRVVRG